MRKYLRLLIALLLLLIPGCKSIPEKKEYTLPPMPEHVEFEPVASVKDMAEVIVKQDEIIKSWEAWGKNVQGIISNESDSCN